MDRTSSDTGSFFDAHAVISRVCDVVGVDSKRALSAYLGRSPSRVGALARDNSLPWEDIVRIALEKNVSLDWLFWGSDRIDFQSDYTTTKDRDKSPTSSPGVSDEESIDRDYATRLVLAIVDGVERALDTADAGLSIERKTKAVGALFRMFAIRGTLPTQAEIDSIIELMQ